MKYIDADKLIERLEEMKQAEYENCGGVNSKTGALQEVQELIDSLQQEQQEVDYNIVPLSEERMASYIAYCLGREDDDCNCPTCGKHVTGLRLFPYYYDRENNDVYFASVCPECGKIIISKE